MIWRGQWMSLHELASLMDKSYAMLYKMQRSDPNICRGIQVIRAGSRLWVRVDEDALRTLLPKV